MRTSVQPLVGNRVKFDSYGHIMEAQVIFVDATNEVFNCQNEEGIHTVDNKDVLKLKTGEGTYVKVEKYYIFEKASGRRYPGWKG